MGINQFWAAYEGSAPDDVCAALGLRRTGEHEEFPESNVNGIAMPNGWYVVTFNGLEAIPVDAPYVEQVLGFGTVLCGYLMETANFSSLMRASGGDGEWSVFYEGAGGPKSDALRTEGDPPPCYVEIRDRLMDRQHGDATTDHLLEVATDLAHELIGYSPYHSDSIEGVTAEMPYEILERI